MFPYRGLIVLIALCAFGAIQAAREANSDEFFRHHRHHNSSNSTHGPSGNHSHPLRLGHNNSHPMGGNRTLVHHPSGNQSHPRPGLFRPQRGFERGPIRERFENYSRYYNLSRPIHRPQVNNNASWYRPRP